MLRWHFTQFHSWDWHARRGARRTAPQNAKAEAPIEVTLQHTNDTQNKPLPQDTDTEHDTAVMMLKLWERRKRCIHIGISADQYTRQMNGRDNVFHPRVHVRHSCGVGSYSRVGTNGVNGSSVSTSATRV